MPPLKFLKANLFFFQSFDHNLALDLKVLIISAIVPYSPELAKWDIVQPSFVMPALVIQ